MPPILAAGDHRRLTRPVSGRGEGCLVCAWRRGREPVRGVGEVPASGGDVVHCVVDVLRRDLRIALGLADAAEVSRGLLLRAGRLDVSATHVELVLSLEQASVPVRLAGLDADPGWVPELGRVVLFHFVREAP